jgi:agmatinase
VSTSSAADSPGAAPERAFPHFGLPERAPGPMHVNRPAGERGLAGIQTFMKLPVCLTPEDLRAGEIDVAICGVPWDGTVIGRSGTHLGPMAIRSADYLGGYGSSLPHLDVRVDPLEHLRACDYGDAEVLVGNTLGTFDLVREFIAGVVAAGATPLILGGDHAITWPTATAVADAYGHGKVGIIHFDAHADTAPDSPGSLASHGTPMRKLIESGAVPGRNFVQVGLRGYWPDRPILDWMEEHELRVHFMAEIRRDGFDAVLERALDEALDSADHLYVSLDVDVCDPAYAPGTGTPEPGGLTSADVLRAVRRLAAEVGIVGMDVVEVSPPYDGAAGITALLAHRAVREAMTGMAMRKIGLTAPDYVDPRSAGTGAARTHRTNTPTSEDAPCNNP